MRDDLMPEKRTRKRTTDIPKEKREDEEAKASLLLQWRSFFEEKNHHHRRRKRCVLHPYWEEKEWKPLRIKSSEEEEEEQLPSREEIISQFGLFGGSKDSSEKNNERQHCEIDFTTGTCANGEKCERCERWEQCGPTGTGRHDVVHPHPGLHRHHPGVAA